MVTYIESVGKRHFPWSRDLVGSRDLAVTCHEPHFLLICTALLHIASPQRVDSGRVESERNRSQNSRGVQVHSPRAPSPARGQSAWGRLTCMVMDLNPVHSQTRTFRLGPSPSLRVRDRRASLRDFFRPASGPKKALPPHFMPGTVAGRPKSLYSICWFRRGLRLVRPIYMTGNCDLPCRQCSGFDVPSVGTLLGDQVNTALWMGADYWRTKTL